MRTVDFDTAAANLNDDDLRAMNRNELKLSYAIFSVMESKLYYIAQEYDTFDDNHHARRDEVSECQDRVLRIYKEVFPNEVYDTNVWCCVFDDDDCITAREITKGVTAKFGTDSIEFISDDRDIFRANTTSTKAQEIEEFMRSEWAKELAGEDIDIDPIDFDEQYPPDLWSWNETEALVKKSKIKITIAPPKVVVKPEDEISDLLVKAKAALIQTGLSEEEALGRLQDLMGLRPCRF